MKRILIYCLAALGLSCAAGLSSELDADGVLARMEEAGKDLKTLKAGFRQERTYALFDEKRGSSGTILYKKPGKMLWKYAKPDGNLIYITGKKALMYLPDIKQVQKISLLKDRKTESLLIGFGNTAEEIKRNFDVRLAGSREGTYTLELVPKTEDISSHLLRLEISIDGKSWLPARSVRFEPGGDRTAFTFTDVTTNLPVEDAAFEFTVPDGVEVVEY